MAVVLNSFICKRPFLANKQNYFHDSFATPTFTFRGGLMLKPFAESFAQAQKKYLRELRKKKIAGSHVGTLAAAIKNLGPLLHDSQGTQLGMNPRVFLGSP